ncbi:phosphotransferase family protein [Cumulibacter soli]|uniref:phosphotransferase family protein n=1 Tax=Cumulibacter soli TaxID=2546344 RepID=UPI00106753DF|nr:phosphotransferase family protein [Cumulibacter soli]
MIDRETIRPRLQRWITEVHDPAAELGEVWALPGHAGLSFGFEVRRADDVEKLVIRLAPPGVRRKGNTDVLRQVPLLKSLDRAGIPVAAVLWNSPDESWFDTDAYIQRFLTGGPLDMANAQGEKLPEADVRPYLANAARVLASIHSVDWRADLAEWEPVKLPEQDIEFWRTLQPKMAEPHMPPAADALADALLASKPKDYPIGVFHGDFHTNNVLFEDDASISGVVDWEISGIGSQTLDIAWLSMMTDLACWAPNKQAIMRVVVDPAWLLAQYQEALGREVRDAAWHKAYACYRFGVITGFNLYLHRSGKRDDPHWEDAGESTIPLFDRGQHLLAHPEDF